MASILLCYFYVCAISCRICAKGEYMAKKCKTDNARLSIDFTGTDLLSRVKDARVEPSQSIASTVRMLLSLALAYIDSHPILPLIIKNNQSSRLSSLTENEIDILAKTLDISRSELVALLRSDT